VLSFAKQTDLADFCDSDLVLPQYFSEKLFAALTLLWIRTFKKKLNLDYFKSALAYSEPVINVVCHNSPSNLTFEYLNCACSK